MKARQIDITKQFISCCDELFVSENGINVTYELYFDVDKYFGTNTNDTDDTWINFYTDWYPDGTVKASYFVDSPLSNDYFLWDLTDKEVEFFRNLMEEYCQECEGVSLMEFWEENKESA